MTTATKIQWLTSDDGAMTVENNGIIYSVQKEDDFWRLRVNDAPRFRAGTKEACVRKAHEDMGVPYDDEDDADHETNGSDKKKPAKKKEKTMAATKTRTKPDKQKDAPAQKPKAERSKSAKGGAETDKFGSRVGSGTAKVNAVLSSTPKTMAQIKEEAGVEDTYYTHLNKLVAAGEVVKTDDGYKLAKKAK